MPILDPNVRRELEAFIDSKHWYNEYQMNPKLLIMRPDQFIELYIAVVQEEGLTNDIDKMGRKLATELANSSASSFFDETKFLNTWKNQGAGAAIKSITKATLPKVIKAIFSALVAGMSTGAAGAQLECNMWLTALSSFLEKL